MDDRYPELDDLQRRYRLAVDAWIAAIRAEEALASTHHTLAQVDRWEHAHFAEEAARTLALAAKADYEAALRERFFGF